MNNWFSAWSTNIFTKISAVDCNIITFIYRLRPNRIITISYSFIIKKWKIFRRYQITYICKKKQLVAVKETCQYYLVQYNLLLLTNTEYNYIKSILEIKGFSETIMGKIFLKYAYKEFSIEFLAHVYLIPYINGVYNKVYFSG